MSNKTVVIISPTVGLPGEAITHEQESRDDASSPDSPPVLSHSDVERGSERSGAEDDPESEGEGPGARNGVLNGKELFELDRDEERDEEDEKPTRKKAKTVQEDDVWVKSLVINF